MSLNRTSIVSEMRRITFQVVIIDGEPFTGGRLDSVKVRVFEIEDSREILIWESNVDENAYIKTFNFTVRKAIDLSIDCWNFF